jgi:hypothetical protein
MARGEPLDLYADRVPWPSQPRPEHPSSDPAEGDPDPYQDRQPSPAASAAVGVRPSSLFDADPPTDELPAAPPAPPTAGRPAVAVPSSRPLWRRLSGHGWLVLLGAALALAALGGIDLVVLHLMPGPRAVREQPRATAPTPPVQPTASAPGPVPAPVPDQAGLPFGGKGQHVGTATASYQVPPGWTIGALPGLPAGLPLRGTASAAGYSCAGASHPRAGIGSLSLPGSVTQRAALDQYWQPAVNYFYGGSAHTQVGPIVPLNTAHTIFMRTLDVTGGSCDAVTGQLRLITTHPPLTAKVANPQTLLVVIQQDRSGGPTTPPVLDQQVVDTIRTTIQFIEN